MTNWNFAIISSARYGYQFTRNWGKMERRKWGEGRELGNWRIGEVRELEIRDWRLEMGGRGRR
jgi:hypothetical protein